MEEEEQEVGACGAGGVEWEVDAYQYQERSVYLEYKKPYFFWHPGVCSSNLRWFE